MRRKCILIVTAVALSSLVSIPIGVGVAGATSFPVNQPGTVTCTSAHGVWSGLIAFSPPLFNGGTSSTETMIIKSDLGNTASPCVTSAGTVALGTITGKLTFTIAGNANNCATIFSGTALPSPASTDKLKMTWSTPSGSNPTKWTQPSAFKVTGSAGSSDIVIKLGTVSGSYTPFANPKATLSDSGWPGTVASSCASTTGLSSLTLATSSGKW
jgi:hypothetical protein